MKAHTRPSTYQDAQWLASRLRKADVEECRAHGLQPLQALTMGHRHSAPGHTMVGADGTPFGMFGAVPQGDFGLVWMLATDGLESNWRAFARGSREVVNGWRRDFAALHNVVDARNTVHVSWLKWLGFRFINRVQINDVPFYEFFMVTDNV